MIQQLIGFKKKYFIKLLLQSRKPYSYFSTTTISKIHRNVFIFLAADYGNLGDVAITFAQTKFLEEYAPDANIIEIPISQSLEGFHFVRRNIKPGDIVTTVGGGNLGDMYDQIEYIRQLVVKLFPNNKIISFPQTFDFGNTHQGNNALKKAAKIYNKHKNLVFVAREKVSYELMQKHFTNATILLTPDIVLSLNKSDREGESGREGAVMCMRSDKEKNLTTSQSEILNDIVSSQYKKVITYDTHLGRNNLSVTERKDELMKIWNAFRNAELVVTDRLHGMIFCYITNTPCLVFLNNNHKVNGTHKWFPKECNIKLIEEFEEQEITDSIVELQSNSFAYSSLKEHYNPLLKQL
ncbi:pyruvyl transferase EpsI [Salegentibacter echinorum]|uniref:Pyruvyl transferase EpsI n=1 Tax=Salegentibacter echinorum TaxID=1073325 RepID=A0A1M5BV11_SALEC|nr:polysaccharide pyruvyl transferase family protein [Salegentibacter echinorum]SHF46285.1 pyruvyl transferase EpsI [Salegentibacter echinorum]